MLNNNLLHSSVHFNLYVYCNKSSLVSMRLIISLTVCFHINIIPGLWYNCLYISLHSLHCCKYCTCYSYSSSINQKASNWTVMLSIRRVCVCWRWVTFANYFQEGFIDHLGGSSKIMLHIAEISCTPASLNFIRTRGANTRCKASGTTKFVADEKEWQTAKYGEEKCRAEPKAEDTSHARRPRALIKTRFSRRRMEPRGVLFISLSPPKNSLSLLR